MVKSHKNPIKWPRHGLIIGGLLKLLHRVANTNHCDLYADISKDNSPLLSPCYIEHIRYQTFVLLNSPLSWTWRVHMCVVSIVHNYLLLYDTHCTLLCDRFTWYWAMIPCQFLSTSSQCKNCSTILSSILTIQELEYNSIFHSSNARITVQFCLPFQQCKN